MAGIGFELKKLIDENTFSGDFKAYFFAGIISSGPWLISIVALGLLWMFSAPRIGFEEQKLFRVIVVYTYAYSLITTGAVQLVITRFLADRLFLKQRNIFLPTYAGLMTLTAIIQGLTASIFYSMTDVDLHFKLSGIILYVAISLIWQTMIFLSASRDFFSIVTAFFWGFLISFVGAMLLGTNFGFNGHLLGFTIGQVIIVILLVYRIFCEFDSQVECNFDFLRQMNKYYDLFLIGIFYFTAVWVDKIIYWYSPTGEHVTSLFYSQFPYDSCMFLAFLTIIPALAYFMVDIETGFYDKFKGFYGAIVNKGALGEIREEKKEMSGVLRNALMRLLVLQILITGVYLFFSPQILKFLQLEPMHLTVIRYAGIGTFFHVLMLVTIIVILYFDRRMIALATSFVFFITNTAFTLAVIKFYPEYMGLGYAASTFVSFIFAFILMSVSVRDIEYLTFTGQPFQAPRLPKATTEEVKT